MSPKHRRWTLDATVWIAGFAMAALLVTEAVATDRRASSATNPTWQSECGSCHVAYPPHLLSAQAWRSILQRLDRHFGVDASVDEATASTIGAFLEANAGRAAQGRVEPSTIRITQTRWFRHEHAEVAPSTWNRSAVGSAANCGACHRNAASGDFSERLVRMPN